MRDTHEVHDVIRHPGIVRCIALFAVLALPGCGAVTGLFGDDEHVPEPAKLEDFRPATGIETLWSRQATSGAGGRHPGLRAAVAGGRVFAAGHDGDVVAYDPFNGKPLWEADTGVPISGGPGAGSGLVVVGSSAGDVVALDAADGALAWRARVSSEVLSPPAIGKRIAVVRTIDGKLFGLDTATGAQSWVYDRTVPVLTLRGTSAPAIAGDVVVAGFDSGHLAAVSLADGRLLWESRITTPTGRTELERLADVDADPVVADGIVYAVTFQGRIAAFDVDTGRRLWERDLSSHAGIGIGRRLVYVTDEQDHVWAFDRGNGSSLWRQDGLERRQVTRPVEFGDYVVVTDLEGYVHWLGIDDGRFAARTRAGSSAVHTPAVTGETAVYVLGESGRLTALTPF